MKERNKAYLEMLKHAFDEKLFINFIKDLINLEVEDLNPNIYEIDSILKQYEEQIKYYKYIANYNDGLNKIGVFIIKLTNNTSTNARNIQRNFVASLLSRYELDASIVAFYSDNENVWRLSFVKKEVAFTEKGIKQNITPAKRFSYLVGENESVHTAQEFLLKLLEIDSRKITLSDIESVFDVEKVVKRFFEEYKEKYLQLKEYLENTEDFITESQKCDFTSSEFAKKLMGQIVFLYFLQKKGWIGVQLVPNEISIKEFDELLSKNDSVSQNILRKFFTINDDVYVINHNLLKSTSEVDEEIINLTNIFKGSTYDKPWGTGEKGFIRSMFKKAIREHKNFFDDYLEKFFYNGLNKKRTNQYFPLLNCKIPFLNGGLFEPLNNYRWSSAHFDIPNYIFSNDEKKGILDFLDLYNFTIDEEEPLEKDIAVDPEMLGKIFENLLDVNDRKSKGAFYTPREIVYYMCQESIANYLVNKIGVDYDEIIRFIKYGDLISHYDWELSTENRTDFEIGKTIYDNLLEIDRALIEIKIADPAVGSGAFPLGMLTEIVKIRDNISNYLLIKKELNLLNLDSLIEFNQHKRDIFDMKLQTIENSIYAVDIETSAIDITKLRLWLSLIVDYPNNEEPQPLPNLDCKIMQGNSLIDEFDGVPLFSEKMIENNLKKYHRKDSSIRQVSSIQIQQTLFEDSINLDEYIKTMLFLQKEYFRTSDNKIKRDLKEKIDSIQLGMVEESLRNDPLKLKHFKEQSQKRQKPWFIWELEFYDVFKNNGGFDIVIGNPPYVGEKGNKEIFQPISKTNLGKRFYLGKMDLFYFFFHKGIDILKEKGQLAFITTNYYITADGGIKLRKDFSNRTNIKKLINFNEYKIFSSARGQHNMITFLEKAPNKNAFCESIITRRKGNVEENKDVLNDIINGTDSETSLYNVLNKDLYDGDSYYIRLEGKLNDDDPLGKVVQKIINKSNGLLGDFCNVNVGLLTGADKLTDSHISKYNIPYPKNSGIYIISTEELNNLNLTEEERKYIVPWFKNSDIKQYYTEENNRLWLINISYPNVLEFNENNFPNIYKHISKYKTILENRKANDGGMQKIIKDGYWWGFLMRQINFSAPKIVVPQRCAYNKFGYNEINWYASFDVYYITDKDVKPFDLKYALAILNSELYYCWLYKRGKRKGEYLELYRKPLMEIPIKLPTQEEEESIVKIVEIISHKAKQGLDYSIEENNLNKLIYDLYDISEEEIIAIKEIKKEI